MSHDLSAHFGCAACRDVVWAHAVNSRAALDLALGDSGVHMLEADLMLAPPRSGTPDAAVPTAEDVIMCHPPASRSDITFDAFLRRVVRAVRAGRVVGVKLDFKHPDAVAPALALLRREGLGRVGLSSSSPRGGSRETSESTSPEAARVASIPVWLNADVIRGPGGREPVHPDGAAFVAACVDACPASTLSLGWTHAGTPGLGYTRDMAARMLALIEPVAQHVTLAASAAHLFASARGARRALLDVVELSAGGDDDATRARRSLTLWGPATRGVTRWAEGELSPERTFVDVKACTALEALVIGAHVALRPAYAPFW